MWFLYAIQDDQKKRRTLLRPGYTYRLGRRDADILPFVLDNSIGREHAKLKIEANDTENWKQADWIPYVLFHDLKSKCGSFINSSKLEGPQLHQWVTLKDGDSIKLGTKTGLFQLIWEPLILCRQAMTQEEKKKLYSAALSIGAKITKSVRLSYTHLLLSNLRVSYKVARCLAEGKPIVSQDWLDSLVDLPDTDFQFPPVSEYLPPLDDSCNGPLGVPDFTPNPKRAQLFANKKFIFFKEDQYQSLSPMVDACSGQSMLLNLNKTDPFEERLGDINTIVVTCDQLQDTAAGKNTINALDSLQRRTIDSMEICWAILYCSTDIQCNASLDMATSNTTSSSNVAGSSTESHDIPIRNLPTTSEQTNVSAPINQRFSSPPLSPNHDYQPSNHTHEDGERINEESLPEQSEKKELDLDDLFDELLGGDEPSRPPPKLKHLSEGPSTSQTTATTTNESGSHARHQERAETISPAKQRQNTVETNKDIMGTTTRRLASNSPSPFPHEDSSLRSSPGPSAKRKRTEEHQLRSSVSDKGKNRMYEVATPISDNNIELNDDTDNIAPASSRQKQRKRKAQKTAVDPMTDDTSSLTGRTPYTLPELENENVDIVPGKNYTKVKYIKMVVAPNPPADWATRQRISPQSLKEINYKTFKKAIQPAPANPLSFVNMATDIHYNSRGLGERSSSPVENDYSDIRIRSNTIRRPAMRL